MFGLLYFYYENKGKKCLKEEVAMKDLEGLIICSPFKGSAIKQQYE